MSLTVSWQIRFYRLAVCLRLRIQREGEMKTLQKLLRALTLGTVSVMIVATMNAQEVGDIVKPGTGAYPYVDPWREPSTTAWLGTSIGWFLGGASTTYRRPDIHGYTSVEFKEIDAPQITVAGSIQARFGKALGGYFETGYMFIPVKSKDLTQGLSYDEFVKEVRAIQPDVYEGLKPQSVTVTRWLMGLGLTAQSSIVDPFAAEFAVGIDIMFNQFGSVSTSAFSPRLTGALRWQPSTTNLRLRVGFGFFQSTLGPFLHAGFAL